MGVSRSGVHAWSRREPSARDPANRELLSKIRRIHAELSAEGVHVGRKRVERLMKADGLVGVSRRRSARTTVRNARVRPARDLVDRDFHAEKPDQLRVADLTYVPAWTGFLYLAVVLEAVSRRIVGWSMGTSLPARLVLAALNMALGQRRPTKVIQHSDQGSQGGLTRSSQHPIS